VVRGAGLGCPIDVFAIKRVFCLWKGEDCDLVAVSVLIELNIRGFDMFGGVKCL